MTTTQPHNIYIHVPFCMSKCKYCAFFSHACAEPDWDAYTRDITHEIDEWAARMGQISVPTVFFGGGTPSLMPVKNWGRIIERIGQKFRMTPDCEISLEANPGTLDAKKLDDFIAAGVNRLSVGVQCMDDERLRFLGRRHSAATARELINTAMRRRVRLSGDFIYGLPGDTPEYIAQLCRQINDIGLQHCSMYELTIEPDTPLGKMRLDMPDNDAMARMYENIGAYLAIPRYEVSNYAAPGAECRHNMNVWAGAPYIGIGRGAMGRVLIDSKWYEQMGAGELFCEISAATRAIEQVITGMRTTRGVRLTPDVMAVIDTDFVKRNPELIQSDGATIAPTAKGMLILDNLLIKLIR